MTKTDKMDQQLVAIDYLVFNRTKSYTDALKTWNAKYDADKTYTKFKIHFHTEFHALLTVRTLTIQDSSITMLCDITEHQNHLSENLSNQFNTMMQEKTIEALNLLKRESRNNKHEGHCHNKLTAKNHTSDNTYMLAIIKIMQSKMEALTSQLALCNNANSTNTGGNISLTTSPTTSPEYNHYCWMCRCCTHWENNCPPKTIGHQGKSSFKDHKNGSDKNCISNRG